MITAKIRFFGVGHRFQMVCCTLGNANGKLYAFAPEEASTGLTLLKYVIIGLRGFTFAGGLLCLD
jgi:hypothetical protein